MAHRYYSEIHLHLVWHTKNSLPLLNPRVEAATYGCIRELISNNSGVILHACGGTPTHVHLCVTIPPTVLISDFVGKIKGASSYELNHQNEKRDPVLQWQSGYGVVSFGTRDLDWVKEYVRNQKEHHARGTAYERLERVTESDG